MIQMAVCFCTVSYQNNQTVFSSLVLYHTNMTQVSAFSCITTTCSVCHQLFLCMITTLAVLSASYRLHNPTASLFLYCAIPTWCNCQSLLYYTCMIKTSAVLSVISTWCNCQPFPVLCHTYMIPLSVFPCTVSYLHDPTVSLSLSCVILTWSHCQSFPVLCHTNMIELAAFFVLHLHDQDVSSCCFSLSHLRNQAVGSFSRCPTYMVELSAVSCTWSRSCQLMLSCVATLHDDEASHSPQPLLQNKLRVSQNSADHLW